MIPKVNTHENPLAIKSRKNKQDSPGHHHSSENFKDENDSHNNSQHSYNNKSRDNLKFTKGNKIVNEEEIKNILVQINTLPYYQKKGIIFRLATAPSSSSSQILPFLPTHLSNLWVEVIQKDQDKLIQRLSGEQMWALYQKIDQQHQSPTSGDLIDISW